VFVSLFFYVASGSVTEMALYSLGRYAGLIVMSLIVVRAFPGSPPRRLFRAGLLLSAAFYGALILLGRSAGTLAAPLGLFNGVALGTYWFGANTLAYDVLTPEERSHYYGWNFALMSVLNVVMPLTAGFVIARVGGTPGYLAVFAICLASFLAAFVSARGLANTPGVGGVSLRDALSFPLQRAEWGRMWIALVLRGFKQASGGVGLVLLVALATHNGSDQGEFAAMASLAGVGTSLLAGRLRTEWRPAGMWIGAAGFAAATLLLFLRIDFRVLLVYAFVTGLIYPGLMVPLASVVLDTIAEDPDAAELRGGYVLSREIAANVGRIIAIALLLALLTVSSPVQAVLAVLTVAALLQLVVAHLGKVGCHSALHGASVASH
jgi:YQGE family putative transporter